MHVPELQTERLLLTLPAASAAKRLAAYASSNKQFHAPWSPTRPPGYYSETFWRRQLDAARVEYQKGQSVRLVLFWRDRPDGPVVGQCNFTAIMRGPMQSCYLGYHLDQEAEGQGLMHEACSAAIPFMFAELGLHRIVASYMPVNQRSASLLRRLGFAVEGYARDYLYLAGAWRDHLITSRLNPHAPVPSG